MNGRKNFHTNLKNQPNEPVGERVVSERGRKELPPSTRGGENLKPNRYYEHKQHAFDSYCKKVLKCEACNGYRQISRHQKRFASLEELSEAVAPHSLQLRGHHRDSKRTSFTDTRCIGEYKKRRSCELRPL